MQGFGKQPRVLLAALLLLMGAFPSLARQGVPDVKPSTIWLMGEVHDNLRGHELRQQLLAEKVAAGWRPAMVMEQFDREQQELLDKARANCQTASCITSQDWLEKWDWKLYEPLIQLALDYSLPLLAANVSRSDVGKIVKGGYPAALDASTISAYQLNQSLPQTLSSQHLSNIMTGHCNMLPPSVAEKMVPAQVARDVWMAKVIEQQSESRDVVLIAGNGHVQKDVGVIQWLPVHLQSQVTVHGFVEDQPVAASSKFDVVHQIPMQKREDPCEVFKTMLGR